MVQVDVFWAYGIGASLAMAAGRQSRKVAKPFETRYFVKSLLLLSLIWAPTGMLLLLRNTSWETMQAAENIGAMPAWLVLAFGITNITQGMLGYWVGLKLVRAGRWHAVNLNWMAGYFGMFFILVYGWDGLGFDRFFYDRDMLPGSPAWTAGAGATVATLPTVIPRFLQSSVAMTLYIDGLFLVPALVIAMTAWWREGMQQDAPGVEMPSSVRMVLAYLAGVFIISLGSAIFCATVVNYAGELLGVGNHVARSLGQIPAHTTEHVISYLIGLPLGLGLMWFALLRPGALAGKLLAPFLVDDDLSAHQEPACRATAPGALQAGVDREVSRHRGR